MSITLEKINIRTKPGRSPVRLVPALIYLIALSAVVGCTSSLIIAEQSVLPWLDNIGAKGRLADIHTVSAKAKVTVSDGLTYTASTVFHDRLHAFFRREYADRTLTSGVEGNYVWTNDGQVETEARSSVEEFVLGHQFHAQLLFLDQIYTVVSTASVGWFAGEKCNLLVSVDENNTWRLVFYNQIRRPMGMILTRRGGEPTIISFKFDDWRDVTGILLPFEIWIDDGEREFRYSYTSVNLN